MFSAFPVLWMPACRLQWKTSAGRCRTWQAAALAKALVRVRLNEKRKPLTTLRTQAAKDAAERRSHRDSRGHTTLDDRQLTTKEDIIGRAGKTTIANSICGHPFVFFRTTTYRRYFVAFINQHLIRISAPKFYLYLSHVC